jgi:hypothetical protein
MIRRRSLLSASLFVAVVAGPAPAEDTGSLCLAAPYVTAETPAQTALAGLVERLLVVRGAYPTLFTSLDVERPTICLFEGSVGARGYFDLGENVIALHAELSEGQKLAVLIHELRHLDQAQRGLCPADNLAMEEVARATFAMEADASAVTAHMAFEMQEAGDGAVWQALRRFENYSDIAVAYAATRSQSGSVARALGAAFEQWYASDWRRERYYVATCSDYLDRIDDAHLLPSYGLLDDAYFDALCRLPDGTPYGCDPPEGMGLR